jgi:hypothetical protein
MNKYLNNSAAHKLAKTLGIRLGTSGILALNHRIEDIIKEAAVKSRKDHRKTILERDVIHEPDLFS